MGEAARWAGPVATAVVLGLCGWLLLTPDGRGADGLLRAGDDVAAGSGRVGGGLFDGVGQWFGDLANAGAAGDRIRELEAENLRLARWRELALELAERSQRYEALLNMPKEVYGEGIEPRGAIGARLMLDSGGAFRRTLLANAGHDQGVRRGFLALNEQGLVGRVVAVGRRSARVLMLDDYNSRVPVVSEQSRVRAVMIGDVGDRAELYIEQGVLGAPRLDFLVGAASLRAGERIITSGDGGLYPRGVLVGWAEPVGQGWRVRLASANTPIDYVRLAPFAPPEAPESNPAGDGGGLVARAAPALGAQAGARPAPPPPPAPVATPAARPAPRQPLPPAAEQSPEAAASGIPEE